jgi:hypothetical protein
VRVCSVCCQVTGRRDPAAVALSAAPAAAVIAVAVMRAAAPEQRDDHADESDEHSDVGADVGADCCRRVPAQSSAVLRVPVEPLS